MRRSNLCVLLILLPLLSLAGGCGMIGFPGVYRIEVEQGNIITQEMIDQLKPGMSRRQVRFILGTPLLQDTFNQQRWDYRYVVRKGNEVLREKHLAIFFDGDTLSHFSGDFIPSSAATGPAYTGGG